MTEINAQEYLEQNWTDQTITKLSSSEKLTGELTIADYPDLEEINLSNHELTSLSISNCPNLKQINVRNNKLTKLELDAPNLEEIIAGQNELTTLDLSNCEQLKKLILPDNPYLTKISGLNLALINNLNLTNTSVSLTEDYEELKRENKQLYQALNRANEARIEKELKWVEPIQTAKQAEEAIKRHLEKTITKWRNYFESDNPEQTKKEQPLLALSFEDPKLRWKAKQVLGLMVEAHANGNYSDLIHDWTEGDPQNLTYDFDGLETLLELWNNYQLLLTEPTPINP